jgi:hypothetical protein
MGELAEHVGDLPNLCGSEPLIAATIGAGPGQPVILGRSLVDVAGIDSAFAVAPHLPQPLLPAGGPDPRAAAIVGNLQWMLEHPDVGDNHNAPMFHRCHQHMGELIPNCSPRATSRAACRTTPAPGCTGCAGPGWTTWSRPWAADPRPGPAADRGVAGLSVGHAVAPSTPVQDYRLRGRAWQHHFAPSSAWRRWVGWVASPRPRWPCPPPQRGLCARQNPE